VPWPEVSIVSMRRELVMLAGQEGANRRELCRHYGVSPSTAYKWLGRADADREESFADRSRRPRSSPARTSAVMQAAVLSLREEHPAWGGRKLRRRLVDLGHAGVPSASTITEILRRHGRLDADAAARRTAWQRFAREAPNELWQMDFKAQFATDAGRCHALSVLDDCSRFALALEACPNQRRDTVKHALTGVFRRYGLPHAMLTDNGPPWGNREDDDSRYTRFEAWLIQLGIPLHHGRAYHPQTQGKDERFHRTIEVELVGRRRFATLLECQQAFQRWRHVYNSERPHEAIGLDTPARRYQPSLRSFPETLPSVDYPDRLVRKVQTSGRISFAGQHWFVGKAFAGHRVALRPTLQDGRYDVFFCQQPVASVDLRDRLP
jgi:transposase InsO family protein